MKLVHICLNGPFTDNLTYQENLLTKYHVKLGYEVYVITSRYIWDSNGNLKITNDKNYKNKDGVNVIRLDIKGKQNFNSKFKRYNLLYETLSKIDADILFIHGGNFVDLKTIKRFLQNNNRIAYLDNHCDKSNSGTNFLSYNILHKIIWKHYINKINPFIKKYYGVMPSRVDWLIDVYGIDKNKCELLVMGADNELTKKYSNSMNVKKIKAKMGIKNDDFVIVTGGKIDKAKYQTILLMKAIQLINNPKIKLFIFGSISDELKNEFNSLCNDNIVYLGWANEEKSYYYFSMADIVIFPGRHSVYWEQVVALKKPIICKYWKGTTHVDLGGNILYLYEDSIDEISNIIEKVVNDKPFLKELKNAAESSKSSQFLYSEISKKALEIE